MAQRVVVQDGIDELVINDMSINFGGGNTAVPQHLLDRPEVSVIVEEMCGKRVAQSVRRYSLR